MFLAHALESIDWTQTHEWVLLTFLVVGIFSVVNWLIKATLILLSRIRERSSKKNSELNIALARIDSITAEFEQEKARAAQERALIQNSLIEIQKMIKDN